MRRSAGADHQEGRVLVPDDAEDARSRPTPAGPPDYIGVYVEGVHDNLIGLFGNDVHVHGRHRHPHRAEDAAMTGARRRCALRGATTAKSAPRWSSWPSDGALLIVIVFGIVEFGNGVERTSSRSRPRPAPAPASAAASATTALADYGLLQAHRSRCSRLRALQRRLRGGLQVDDDRTGSVRARARAARPSSQTNVCNVYTGSQLEHADAGRASPARHRAPARRPTASGARPTRQNVQSQGADYLGVYVKADYATVTGFFESPFALSSRAVMRLEPK